MMASSHTTTTYLISALFLCMTAHAQKRKPVFPEDTIAQEVILQDLLYRHPPEVENSEEKIFRGPPERQPEFPGGTHAMYKFIQTNLRMPRQAKKAGVSGKVFVSFTITETGEVSNVTVFKKLGFGCDEEAVRIVRLMPRWKPGTQFNKIVRVRYNLPISFIAN